MVNGTDKSGHNGHRVLLGVATVIVAAVIMGMVGLYADVHQMKGNRFTVADAYESEMRMRAEFDTDLSTTEIRLREEWLEGLARIEVAIEQLRRIHMEGR